MTAHNLAALLLAGPDDDVFMAPNVDPVDAIEHCPGDETWGLDAYVVLHSDDRNPT